MTEKAKGSWRIKAVIKVLLLLMVVENLLYEMLRERRMREDLE